MKNIFSTKEESTKKETTKKESTKERNINKQMNLNFFSG